MKRRRRSLVQLAGEGPAFTESAGSHADIFTSGGATTPSLPAQAAGAPRSLLSRILAADGEPEAARYVRGVWGGRFPPQVGPRGARVLPLTLGLRGRFPARRREPVARAKALVPSYKLPSRLSQTAWSAQLRELRVRHPARDVLCVRRLQRKQVLFAKRVAGHKLRRSPGRGGSYHRTEWSSYRC